MVEEQKKAKLYERVADHISHLIKEGTFSVGDRIPSVRGLCREMKVSVSTVMEAYHLLEDRGLVEARPQSGYYVRPQIRDTVSIPDVSRIDINPESVTIPDFVRFVLRDIANPDLVQLGCLQPNPDLLPIDRLNLTLSAAVRRHREISSLYGDPQGYMPLRIQISKRLLTAGCTITPDEIMITSGCQEAILFSLLTTCEPGDTIAVESPVFFNLLQMLRTFHIRVIEVPSHPRDGLIIEALRQAAEDNVIKACFASTNFSTPLGSVMPDERKQELVALLAERGIPLIEDDIYGDICFGSERPRAAKCFDISGNVLLCSSFSKSLAPGYRVGWVVPGRYRKGIELAKAIGNFATAMPPQIAIAEFLASGGYDRHLRRIRRLYAQKTTLMAQAVAKFFPEGTRVNHPEGGFSLWVELPKYADSLRLYEQARSHGISFVPGPLFSASFRRYQNFLRLNAAYWSDKAEKAIAAIGHLAEGMKPRS